MKTKRETKRKTKPRRASRFIRRVIALALFAAGSYLLLRKAEIPLPQSLADKLAALGSDSSISVEMSGLSFDFAEKSAKAARIAIHAKGFVGDPIVQINAATVRVSPRFGKPEISWVRSVRYGNLVVSKDLADPGKKLFAADGGKVPTLPRIDKLPVSVENATICGIAGINVSAEFSTDGATLRADKIQAVFADGKENATGSLAHDLEAKKISVNIAGDVTPRTMIPLFEALKTRRLLKILAEFDFPNEPPKVAFSLDCALDKADGEFRVDVGSVFPCSYRAVPVSSFSGVITSSGTNLWRDIRITDLGVRRPEGAAFGTVKIDTTAGLVSFTGDSKMDPLKLAVMAHILETEPGESPFVFPVSPHVRAEGDYDLSRNEISLTAITGTIDAPRADFIKNGHIENAKADFFVSGSELRLENGAADAFGGKITGAASLVFTPPTNRAFTVSVKLDDFKFARLALLAEHEDLDSKGRIDASLNTSGVLTGSLEETLVSLTGAGAAAMEDARIYRVPLFAGLTGFLAKYVPGVDFLVSQNELKLKFELDSEGVKITDMNIIGIAFSASAHGRIGYDGNINIRLKGHLMNKETWVGKALNIVLYPVSKVLEFRAEGSIKNPKWSLVTF